MNRKGISQILFLIIAASVLMMVALTLIFMFQSGASDTTQQADAQTCRSSAQAQCSNFGSASIVAPSACTTSQAGEVYSITGIPFPVYDNDPAGGSTSATQLPDMGSSSGSTASAPYYVDCSDVI